MLSQKVGTSSAVTDQPATEPHGLRQMRQMISLAGLLDYIVINTFFFSPWPHLWHTKVPGPGIEPVH